MLTIYRDSSGSLRKSQGRTLPKEVIWIDLLNPTDDEKAFVEARAAVRVPSIEALSEIESSSRLIAEHDVIYLSMPLVAQGDTPELVCFASRIHPHLECPGHRSICRSADVQNRGRKG